MEKIGKSIPTLIGLILLGLYFISISSCNYSSTSNDNEQEIAYACPMQCEGDKTYSETGNCPVCGMELVNVNELEHKSGDAHEHDHDHDHGEEAEDAGDEHDHDHDNGHDHEEGHDH